MNILNGIKRYYGRDRWKLDMAIGALTGFFAVCLFLIWVIG